MLDFGQKLHQNKRRFQTGKRWLMASGAIALVPCAGIALLWRDVLTPEAPVSVRVVIVERQDIEVTINEGGIVKFANQQTLTSPAEGAVDKVFVRPGDRVTAGQTLMTLRKPERETALALQEVLIQSQKAQLLRTQQQVIEAEAQLEAEQEELENLKRLFEQGGIAQTEFKGQESIVRQSIASVRDAELQVSITQTALNELRLERQRIERELQDTIIQSPIDGLVLSVAVKDGDGVVIQTELMTLGDPRQELVELELSTLNASKVSPGQQTRVSIIGPDPTYFAGTVVDLYPQAIAPSQSSASNNSSDTGQPRVPTIVQLDEPSNSLIPGGLVNVEIILEERQNVVSLNIEAIQDINAQPYVWMMDTDGRAIQQSVELGLEGLTHIEIKDGLSTGDEVLLPPLDRPLSVGVPVVREAPFDEESGNEG